MSEFIWKKSSRLGADVPTDSTNAKKVLVIYTGGTIGMKWSKDNGYQPAQNYLEKKIQSNPFLCDPDVGPVQWEDMGDLRPMALPRTFEGHRILYSILEYSPLLDSSNLSMEDWARMARDIERYYSKFQGFVILHGTDTMAYTVSALSFMLQNLGKPVVMTGSQVPISELRNDARDNILGALILAGQYVIPEVTVYFNNKLYRGNRVTKMNSSAYNAFNSPNIPPLATIGVDISVEWDAIQRPAKLEKFKVNTEMNNNVGILRFFPGITASSIRSFFQPPMEGVVLQTYGAGNIPDTSSHSDIFQVLKSACERGVVIVNCTQCSQGTVSESYAGGIKLRQAGVVPGADMTTEAALTKLSYLLGQKLPREEIKKCLIRNMSGELTVLDSTQHQFSLRDSVFLETVAKALSVSSSQEVKLLRRTLFPPLLCAAAATGDIECLLSLRNQGGDFNQPDYNGRSPLHVAASHGHLETVRMLLSNGASVHVTDMFNKTPLDDAMSLQRDDVVGLLLQTGAEMRPSRSAPNFHTLHTDHTPFGTRATNDLEEVDRGESLVSGLVMKPKFH
ncbi:L-asparaginase 1-like [Halichondria panicea]|uniref:L-asparaginase 1-like n=1 Tax=Halichondria panicea TaxID=6063 RepID=UPI00312B7E75